MQLTAFARKVPEEGWTLFAPMLPPVVWCGNGCPPYDHRECVHAVLYGLVMGSGWRILPQSFPSSKTVQRRLTLQLPPPDYPIAADAAAEPQSLVPRTRSSSAD